MISSIRTVWANRSSWIQSRWSRPWQKVSKWFPLYVQYGRTDPVEYSQDGQDHDRWSVNDFLYTYSVGEQIQLKTVMAFIRTVWANRSSYTYQYGRTDPVEDSEGLYTYSMGERIQLKTVMAFIRTVWANRSSWRHWRWSVHDPSIRTSIGEQIQLKTVMVVSKYWSTSMGDEQIQMNTVMVVRRVMVVKTVTVVGVIMILLYVPVWANRSSSIQWWPLYVQEWANRSSWRQWWWSVYTPPLYVPEWANRST